MLEDTFSDDIIFEDVGDHSSGYISIENIEKMYDEALESDCFYADREKLYSAIVPSGVSQKALDCISLIKNVTIIHNKEVRAEDDSNIYFVIKSRELDMEKIKNKVNEAMNKAKQEAHKQAKSDGKLVPFKEGYSNPGLFGKKGKRTLH